MEHVYLEILFVMKCFWTDLCGREAWADGNQQEEEWGMMNVNKWVYSVVTFTHYFLLIWNTPFLLHHLHLYFVLGKGS